MNQNIRYTKVKLTNLSINDDFGISQYGGKQLSEEKIIQKIFTIGIIPFLSNKYKTIERLSKDPTKLTQITKDSDFNKLLKQYNEFLEDLKYNEEARNQLMNNLFLLENNFDERIAINNLLNKCCGILSGQSMLPKAIIINTFEKFEDLKQKDTYKRYKLYLIESINDYLESSKTFYFGLNQKVDPKPADHGVGAINESLYHNKRILELLAKEGQKIYDKYNIEKRRTSLLEKSKMTINWDGDWSGIKYNFKNYIKRGDSIDKVNAKKVIKKRLAKNKKERRDILAQSKQEARDILAKPKLKMLAVNAIQQGKKNNPNSSNVSNISQSDNEPVLYTKRERLNELKSIRADVLGLIEKSDNLDDTGKINVIRRLLEIEEKLNKF